MRTEISRLHKQLERTMIYVTHEAMSMGDRIVVMKDGTVQQVDVPLVVCNHLANRFVAGFIGSPTMNFFDGRVVNGGGVWFEMTGGHFMLPIIPVHRAQILSHMSAEITVGIRPEHIT
jgi:multiple sugar transport system ATP-binding protein